MITKTPEQKVEMRRRKKAWCDKLMTVPPDDIKIVLAMTIDERIIYFNNPTKGIK